MPVLIFFRKLSEIFQISVFGINSFIGRNITKSYQAENDKENNPFRKVSPYPVA